MGMPLEINTVLKLTPTQGYPNKVKVGDIYIANKQDYRIYPLHIPIPLVDKDWNAYADAIVFKLIWEDNNTQLLYEIVNTYEKPKSYKH